MRCAPWPGPPTHLPIHPPTRTTALGQASPPPDRKPTNANSQAPTGLWRRSCPCQGGAPLRPAIYPRSTQPPRPPRSTWQASGAPPLPRAQRSATCEGGPRRNENKPHQRAHRAPIHSIQADQADQGTRAFSNPVFSVETGRRQHARTQTIKCSIKGQTATLLRLHCSSFQPHPNASATMRQAPANCQPASPA